MVKMDSITHRVEIPDGVTATMVDGSVSISSDGTTVTREFTHRTVSVRQVDSALEVFCNLPRKKERALAGTWAAHLGNMVHGVTEGFEYTLKAVYSHFPMTIKVDGDRLLINNLFGEKVPRQAALPWSPAEVQVKIQNKTDVIVSGSDKEKVGQTSANIERACRIRGRDRRVFQDGIYVVSKK